jgi:hypothetical protein
MEGVTTEGREGGEDEEDSPFSTECRIRAQQAISTERSSCWGARDTIAFDPTRNDDVGFYPTEEGALEDLREQLRKLPAEYKMVVDKVRSALDCGVIEHFLREKRLAIVLKQCGLNLPPQLNTWLLCLGLSAGMPGLEALGRAALEAMLSVREAGVIEDSCPMDTALSFCCYLEYWVPKRTRLGRSSVAVDCGISESKNLGGLMNMLVLLDKVLPDKISECHRDTFTWCIISLTFASIDSALYTNQQNVANKRMTLRTLLKRLIASMVNLVAGLDGFEDWMKTTADVILQGVGSSRNSSDENDSEEWTSCSALVRAIPYTNDPEDLSTSVSSTKICSFKVVVALRALELCLGTPRIRNDIVGALSENEENKHLIPIATSSLSWTAIGAAYAALVDIERKGDNIYEDPPHCLAIIECLFAAFQAGLLLLDKAADATDEYGTQDQAKLVYELCTLFDNQCGAIMSSMGANMGMDPHFRRVDYYLECYHQYYIHVVRTRTAKLAGISLLLQGSPVAKQASLKTFFTSKPKAAPSVSG